LIITILQMAVIVHAQASKVVLGEVREPMIGKVANIIDIEMIAGWLSKDVRIFGKSHQHSRNVATIVSREVYVDPLWQIYDSSAAFESVDKVALALRIRSGK